jgi:enamine deaminase RidA (YjgF/YER057c/UK114 family)
MVKMTTCSKSVFDPRIHRRSLVEPRPWCSVGSSRLLTTTGAVGAPGDFCAQARQRIPIKAQVEAAGGTLANVVKLNTYLVDIRHAPSWRGSRGFFGKKAPALHARRRQCLLNLDG